MSGNDGGRGPNMAAFSHSRIDAYETCPKKYEFAYILKAPRGPSGIEAFMGSRVHDALEWLYEQVRLCRVPAVEDLVARYAEVWDAEWSDDVRVTRAGVTADDYRSIGEKALREYHARYQPFDQGVTVGLEMKVRLGLDDEHEIMGFVDRVVKTGDGTWEIHDYKTANRLPTQDKVDADRQLALYALAIQEMYADATEIELVWHYVAFDQEVRSSRTPEQLAALREQVLAKVLEIEAQTEFPTSSGPLCDWCDYARLCPAKKHLHDLSDAGENEYAAQELADIVDRYAALGDEVSALTAEKERLGAEIVRRADEAGLDQVFGAAFSCKVYRFSGASMPGRDDPGRGEVEAILRESGEWERFATLSPVSLAKAYDAGDLGSGTMERLAPYVSTRGGSKLYTRKRA
jgi:putative RecB family exonuclease